MPESASSRQGAAFRAQASRFWRWWTQELQSMVPERFGALGGVSRLPQLRWNGGDLLLADVRDAGAEPVHVPLDPHDGARSRSAVRAALEAAGESRGRARLLLGDNESLLRRASMPAATEENLSAVLGFEMDRLTPFRAEEVYYDYRVVGRNPAAGTINVLLAVARKDVVDAQVERLRALGVSVQGAAPAGDNGSGAPLDVLPTAQRGERESSTERTVRNALVTAVVVLFMAALALPIVRKQQTVRELTPLVEKAHAEAQSTDALVQQLEQLAGDYNFLLARKHGTPPALAYVEEMTRLLPDNTWLQQLDLRTAGKVREMQVSGETPSSSRLIEVIEQSELFRNVTPRGSVTRGTQPGVERFVVAAETEARALPEARKATEIVTMPATQGRAPAPGRAPAQPPAPPSAAGAPKAAVVQPVAPAPAPANPPAQAPRAGGK